MKRFSASLVAAAVGLTAGASDARPDMQVFLLIGQSNMAGRGAVEAADRVAHPRVFVLTRELMWAPAVDPLHWDKPERVGTGLGKTFGETLAEAEPGAAIGLVPAAYGGSALDEWAPGQPHYANAVTRARAAMQRGRLAGILWHQGEADSAPERAATYAPRFAAMIARLRADLGAPDVPVIVGETGRFRANGGEINAVLATLPDRVPGCAFVSAEGLTHQGDKLHFDATSFRELGRRYAAAWRKLAAGRK